MQAQVKLAKSIIYKLTYEDIVRKSELLPPMFLSLLEIKMLDRR